MPLGAAGSTSVANIVINATDNASGVIAGIQLNFGNLSKLVNEPLQNALSNLSRTTNSVSQNVVDKIGSIGEAFKNLSINVAGGVDFPLDGITRSLVKIPELFESAFTRGSLAAQIALAGIGGVNTGNLTQSLNEVPQLFKSTFTRSSQTAQNALSNISGIDTGKINQSLGEIPQLFNSAFNQSSQAATNALQKIGGIDTDKLTQSINEVPRLLGSSFTHGSQAASTALQNIGELDTGRLTQTLGEIPTLFNSAFTRGGQAATNALQNIGEVDTSRLTRSLTEVPLLFTTSFNKGAEAATNAIASIGGVDTGELNQSLSEVPVLFSSTFTRSTEVAQNALQDIGELDNTDLTRSLTEIPPLFTSAFTRGAQSATNALEGIGEINTDDLTQSLGEVPQLFNSTFTRSTQLANNALDDIGELDTSALTRSLTEVPSLFADSFTRGTQAATTALQDVGGIDTNTLNQSLRQVPVLFGSAFDRGSIAAQDAIQNIGSITTVDLTQSLAEVPGLFNSAFTRGSQSATTALQNIDGINTGGLAQSLNEVPQLFNAAFTSGTKSAQNALQSIDAVDTDGLARSLGEVPQLFTSAFTRSSSAATRELQNIDEFDTGRLTQSLGEVPSLFASAFNRGNQLAQNTLQNIGGIDSNKLNQSLADVPALFNSAFTRGSQVAQNTLQNFSGIDTDELTRLLTEVPNLFASTFNRSAQSATNALQNVGNINTDALNQSLGEVPQLFNSAFNRGNQAAQNAIQAVGEIDTGKLSQSLGEVPSLFNSSFTRSSQLATNALQSIGDLDTGALAQSLTEVPVLFSSAFSRGTLAAQNSLQSVGGVDTSGLTRSLAEVPNLFASTFNQGVQSAQNSLQNIGELNTGELTQSLAEVPPLFSSAFTRSSQSATNALQNIGVFDTGRLNQSLGEVPQLFNSAFTRGKEVVENTLQDVGGINTGELARSLNEVPSLFSSAFTRGSQSAQNSLQDIGVVNTDELTQSLSEVPQIFNSTFVRSSQVAQNALQSIGEVDTGALSQSLGEIPSLFASTFNRSRQTASSALKDIGGVNTDELNQSLGKIPQLFNSAFSRGSQVATDSLQTVGELNTDELTRSLAEIPPLFNSTFTRSSQSAQTALQSIGGIDTGELNQSLSSVPQLFTSTFDKSSQAAQTALQDIGGIDTGELNQTLRQVPVLFNSTFTRSRQSADNALQNIGGVDTSKLNQSLRQVPVSFASAFERGSAAAQNSLQNIGGLDADDLNQSLDEVPKRFEASFGRGSVAVQNAIKEIGTATGIIQNSGAALGVLGIKARDSGVEVLKLGSQVTQLGAVTTTAIGGSVLGSFNTLSEAIANIKKALNAPAVKSFIDLIRQQAEDATKEVAPLSDILKETTGVSGDFAKGFVGTTSVLDTLDVRVKSAADKAGDSFQKSIADKFKSINIDFGGAKLPGLENIASLIDKQIAGSISNSLLDKIVGTGPVQNLAKNLITSPAITQLLPNVASELIGGSLVGSVDAALGLMQAEGARAKVSQAFNFADSLAIPSIEIPGVKMNSQTILRDIEGTLSSAVLSTGIQRAVGSGPIANALNTGLRGLAQTPILQGILPQFIRDLSTGSFTEATKGLFVSTFTSGFKSTFTTLNNLATDGGEELGGRIGTKLIEGMDDETKKKLANTRAILGSALDGIGEKMAKSVRLGSKLPGISQLFPELGALNKVDDLLFGAFSKGIGALVQTKLPRLFLPLVDAATGAVGDAGATVVSNAIASFFPKYLRGIVASTVKESGVGRGIFDAIFANIQPDALRESIGKIGGFADSLLGNIKTGILGITGFAQGVVQAIINGLNSIDGVLAGTRSGIRSVATFLTGFLSGLGSGISSAIGGITGGLAALRSSLPAIASVLSPITSVFATMRTGVVDAVGFIRSGFASLGTTAASVLGGMQRQLADIAASTDSFIGGIQSRAISAIASVGGFIQTQINTIRTLIPSLLGTVANGLDSFNASISGGTLLSDLANSVRGLASPIDATLANINTSLSAAFTGLSTSATATFTRIRSAVSDAFSGGITSLGNLKTAATTAFGSIDSTLGTVKTAISGFGVSIGQVDGAIAKIQSGFATAGTAATTFISDLIRGISGAEGNLDTFIAGIQSSIAPAIAGVTGGLSGALSGIGAGGTGAASFVDGIKAAIPSAVSSLQGYVTTLEGLANTAFEQIRGVANGVLGQVIDLAGEAITAINENFVPGLASAFEAIDGYFGGIFSESMSELARNAAAGMGRGFVGSFVKQFGPALDAVDGFVLDIQAKLSGLATSIAEPIGAMANVPGAIAGFTEPLEVFGILQDTVGKVTGGIFELTQKMAFFTQGFDAIKQLASGGPFQALIGQTVELRSQLLSTQSSLVGTMSIMQNGMAIEDPTKAITSLEEPIRNVIETMRTESLELVGVTSNDLVPLFQVLAGQMGAIGADLGDVKDLTLDFAASLGTLGIPLGMARQEIASIATGQIDMNSALAKSLNITNEQVANWKSQGKFVEELRKRLEAFRAGNAIAAKSLSGVTSNIQEIFDEITRKAGEKLLDPLLDQLAGVYNYLVQNKEMLIEGLNVITDYILQAGLAVADTLKALFTSLGGLGASVPQYLFKSLSNGVVEFSKAIQFTLNLLQPTINIIVELAKSAAALAGPFLSAFLTLKSLEFGVNAAGRAFGILSQVLPGVGELMFLTDQRSSGVINQFVTMTKVVGSGGSAFLLLGQNIANIPGGLAMISKAMGPFGGLFAGFIPQIATVGIQVVGLIKMFPALGGVLGNLLTMSPALVQTLKVAATGPQVLGGALAPLGGLFDQASEKLKVYAYSTDRAGLLSQQLKTVLFDVGKSVAQQVFSFGLLAAGAFLAFKAFDEFVLKNEDLKIALGYVAQGLGVMKDLFLTALTNPISGAIIAVVALRGAIALGLMPAIQGLIATTVTQWFTGLSTALGGAAIAAGSTGGAIGGLAGVLNALKLTGMAAGASEAAAGFAALSQAITAGTLTFTRANAVMALQAIAFKVAAAATAIFNGVLRAVGLGNTALAASSAAASAGLATQGAVAAGASGGFALLAGSVWSVVAGLTALLLPIIAVGAAIAAMGSIIYTGIGPIKGIADNVDEATEVYKSRTEEITDASFSLAAKLKAAAKQQKEADIDGVKLTDEQYKANAKLQAQGKSQVITINEQIAALQEAKKERFADKDALEAQEKQLVATRDALNKLSTEIKIAPKPLQELGTSYDQIASKAKSAEKAITDSSGDPEMFKKKGQELIDLTQKQLESGEITTEEANRRFASLATNVYADQEVQIKAQQAITKANEDEGKKRVENKEAEVAGIEAKVATGTLKEVEGAIATTKARNEQTQIQLENAKIAHEERMRLLDEEEQKSLEKLRKQADASKIKLDATPTTDTTAYKQAVKANEAAQEQLATAESSFNNKRTEENRKFNNTRTKLEADQQKNTAEGAKRVADEQQKELQSTQKKAIDAVKIAQSDRLISEQKLYNQGAISKAQFDEAKAQSTIKTTEAELNAEKAKQAQLEQLVATAATPKLRKELEGQLRESRIKTQDLTQKSLDSERQAYEAHIATVKATLERQSNVAQAKDESNVREGVIIKETAESNKADATVKRIQAELALETKDKDKRAQLNLQLQQALTAQEDARLKEKTQKIDNANTEQEASEERAVRSGLAIREEAEARKAKSAIARIQVELDGEKDINKRTQLKLQLEQSITKAQDAEIQTRLKLIENANTQEQAYDEEAYRTGKIKKEQYEVEKAEATVSRLEQELELEKNDVNKRIALELQVQQARTSLQEAQLTQRKAQIEEENQAYQNQLDRQLEPLKAQQSAFDLLNKALENRNKLLSASKDLIQAGSNYLTGQLEAISSVETSEYRRKQLAQGIAAIKLDAAKKEAEMTAASLEAEQQMQRFALMREQIENRVALARQVGETAKLQGQIAVAEADPRTSKAQKDALYIQLDAAKQQQAQLKGIGVLLAQQAPAQEKVFALQKRSKQLEAEGTVTQAQAALINTLGPGSKERAARAFQEQQSQKVFGTSYQDVRSGSRALARETVDREVPGANLGTGAGISGFAPYLEEVNGSVAAMAQANTDLARTMGPAATAGVGLVGAGAAPLRLPDVVGRIPGLDEINRGSQDAIAQSLQAYQQEGLKLPTGLAGQQLQLPKVSTDGMAKSSSTFEKAVSQFAKAVQSSQQTKKPTGGNNVTLNVNQSQSSDIGNILNLAKQLS